MGPSGIFPFRLQSNRKGQQMKIIVAELKDKLSKLMPGLAGRSPIKDVKHFAFLEKEIITYNDQVCIGVPFQTDFMCTVPADELLDILSGINETEIDISLQGNVIAFQSPSTKAELTIQKESQLLTMINSLDIPEEGWKRLPEDFLTGIGLCAFSTSKDMTQGALNCVAVNGTQVYSSDTFRISSYTMKQDMNAGLILIPVVAVKDLIKYRVDQFCVDKSWIHFEDESGLVFSSRILPTDYPDILSLLNLEGITTVEMPKELKEILGSTETFTRGDFEIDKKVQISVSTGLMVCRVENQSGFVEKNLTINYQGESFNFFINPVFLSQILEKSTLMKIHESRNKALFLSEQFKHLMVLIKQ